MAAEIEVRDILWEDDGFNMGRAASAAICKSEVMALDVETPVIMASA